MTNHACVGLEMENKPFIISILFVFTVTVIMSFTGYLGNFTFFYFIKNNTLGFITCFMVLNILVFYTIVELVKVTGGIRYGYYKYLLISILIIFGFNIWGITYSILFKISLNESLLPVIFNSYVLLFIIYLLFKYLLIKEQKSIGGLN